MPEVASKKPKETVTTEEPSVRLYNAVWLAAYDMAISLHCSKRVAKRIAVESARTAESLLLMEMS